MPVLDLGKHRRVWLLEIEGRDAIRSKSDVVCHGWGLPFPRPFSAVFLHNERLWLQVGLRRWSVADIASVEQEKEGLFTARYRLVMNDGTAEIVRFRYSASAVAQAILDPTYDEIESWSHDIMKVLPYKATDGWTAGSEGIEAWMPRVIDIWRKGISPNGTLVE